MLVHITEMVDTSYWTNSGMALYVSSFFRDVIISLLF